MANKIIVLGSNFAGTTTALELSRKLKKESIPHEIQVISPTDKFLYVPSLIWVPFGGREIEDISFPIAPVYSKYGVRFTQERAVRVDPNAKQVHTDSGAAYAYDYLVAATGVSIKTDVALGLENTECIVTPPMALKCREAFEKFVQNPGPAVVGATQGASCMGAGYEFLFNFEKELRRRGVRKKVPLTWITPEPELGHFGIGGIRGGELMLKAFMSMFDMSFRVNAKVDSVTPGQIELAGGEKLPYNFAMLIPPFEGADVMKNSPELVDEKGFVPCEDTYQSTQYDSIYAAGLAVQVKAPFKDCTVPFGVPKTGFPSDVQGKIVAHNITEQIKGSRAFKVMPFGKIPGICIMDAGAKEVWILTDHLFKPRRFEIMIPNVFYNVGKLLLEKYMLFKNRLGWTFLP
jgi:sulfide:quinone oxidoreductase